MRGAAVDDLGFCAGGPGVAGGAPHPTRNSMIHVIPIGGCSAFLWLILPSFLAAMSLAS